MNRLQMVQIFVRLVPGTGFEPARLRATPSRWCVYQFHHPGKDVAECSKDSLFFKGLFQKTAKKTKPSNQ